jgi:dihydrofolate synthase/folylpolyglutamate synthase
VVDHVVAETCASRGAPLVRSSAGVSMAVSMDAGRAIVDLTTPRTSYGRMTLALRGAHQVGNALTAVRLLEELSALGHIAVPATAIRTALEDVSWPGRLELLRDGDRDVLIDGAHNPAGARALASFLAATYPRPVPMVIGVMRDKEIDAILQALAPVASTFVFVAADSPRAATPAELVELAKTVAPAVPSESAVSPMAGVRVAQTRGGPVIVAGSLYLAGEVRAKLS